MATKTRKQIEFLKFSKSIVSKNYFSQNGEDGFLEGILSRIPEKDFNCVEFGAWDGQHLSNTYHLISEKNYRGVLIEGENERFIDLKTICPNSIQFVSTDGWIIRHLQRFTR